MFISSDLKAFVVASLFLLSAVSCHGGHGDAEDASHAGEDYAQRHMATEHHIDSFDLGSFFHLHDLNRDGFWDREEIEAIYGVHHVYSQKKSKDEIEHQNKANHIAITVLKLLDKDEDGKVSLEEFEETGSKGLPSFDDLGAEGHHYDVESEFFLHHEEQFHSTPETQTDESYVHPEDIEHFAQHEAIEREEAEREAKFQGITVDEALREHEHDGESRSELEAEQGAQQPMIQPESEGDLVLEPPVNDATMAVPADKPKITRGSRPEKQDPSVKFKDLANERENQPEWGTGDEGYKPPKSPADKMRKNLPYKYKFRRNWGDF